jgi:hypothetical protein
LIDSSQGCLVELREVEVGVDKLRDDAKSHATLNPESLDSTIVAASFALRYLLRLGSRRKAIASKCSAKFKVEHKVQLESLNQSVNNLVIIFLSVKTSGVWAILANGPLQLLVGALRGEQVQPGHTVAKLLDALRSRPLVQALIKPSACGLQSMVSAEDLTKLDKQFGKLGELVEAVIGAVSAVEFLDDVSTAATNIFAEPWKALWVALAVTCAHSDGGTKELFYGVSGVCIDTLIDPIGDS